MDAIELVCTLADYGYITHDEKDNSYVKHLDNDVIVKAVSVDKTKVKFISSHDGLNEFINDSVVIDNINDLKDKLESVADHIFILNL